MIFNIEEYEKIILDKNKIDYIEKCNKLSSEDWTEISKLKINTIEFIEKYKDKLDLFNLDSYNQFDIDILLKYNNKLTFLFFTYLKVEKIDLKFIKANEKKINWDALSENKNLDDEIILKYKDYLNFDLVSKYKKLNKNFIKRNYKKINVNEFHKNKSLTEEIISEILDKDLFPINFSTLLFDIKFSEKFLEKYEDKLDWNLISVYQDLSENFIRKYKDKLSSHFINITGEQQLSEEFIEEQNNNHPMNSFEWANISSNQKLSESFIEKYINELDWHNIIQYQKLSEEFLNKYNDKGIFYAFEHQKLSEEFIEKELSDSNSTIKKKISLYQTLSEEFIERHKNILNMSSISQYQTLSEEFIERHKNILNMSSISQYQTLSEEFILNNLNYLSMNHIIKYNNISEKLIEKLIIINKDLIDFKVLSQFGDFSWKFYKKYENKFYYNNIILNKNINKDFKLKFDKKYKEVGIVKSDKELLDFKLRMGKVGIDICSKKYEKYNINDFEKKYLKRKKNIEEQQVKIKKSLKIKVFDENEELYF